MSIRCDSPARLLTAFCSLSAISLALSSCGGGGSTDAQTQPEQDVEQTLSLSNSPKGLALRGMTWTYKPRLSDKNRSQVRYSFDQLPTGMVWNDSKGQLNGPQK